GGSCGVTGKGNRKPTRKVAPPAASSCPPKTQTRRTRHRPLTTTPTSNAEQTKPPLPRPAPLTIPRDDRLREESRLEGGQCVFLGCDASLEVTFTVTFADDPVFFCSTTL